jgi:nucleoside-diphosphate-sugar epimerase
MDTLIVGCGELGRGVAALLTASGDRALGVRRTAASASPAMIAADAADEGAWAGIADDVRAAGMSWPLDAVLLSANPGVRRGGDNRLDRAAELIRRHLPGALLVYTGSTAVYADAGGADVDESGRIDEADPAVAKLMAIERAVLAQPRALVLRLPALVGPSRTHALERLRAGERTVRGDLARPFSFVHERDAAELCVEALRGRFGGGVLNAASPARISAGDYYAELARLAGVQPPSGDASPAPSRRVVAPRLWTMLPDRAWRSPTSS